MYCSSVDNRFPVAQGRVVVYILVRERHEAETEEVGISYGTPDESCPSWMGKEVMVFVKQGLSGLGSLDVKTLIQEVNDD